jgi:Ca2+:H+ antiporter
LHTNQTIGALLNATFGNAPELLISVAALRSGFYRVVQLTMLGSMLTNMIFVFGVSCFIGGLRWQVQELRHTSGNVSVGMLLLSTAGSLIPATLILSGHFQNSSSTRTNTIDSDMPSDEEVTLSRVNAFVMFVLYLCYLLFQLETHKDEFEDNEQQQKKSKPNVFCRKLFSKATSLVGVSSEEPKLNHCERATPRRTYSNTSSVGEDNSESDEEEIALMSTSNHRSFHVVNGNSLEYLVETSPAISSTSGKRRRRALNGNSLATPVRSPGHVALVKALREKSKNSDVDDTFSCGEELDDSHSNDHSSVPLISLRAGLVWLFIITLCVSAMSDILVDTIDGFAQRMQLSEVFTSMVIIPFFSNVAEQVSAFLFAYRNEMDLCVGVSIGSAIQIATFVLPGSVLIGMFMDRSMTLYFHSYETACLFFCTIVVAAVLQGGTTNWLVGAILIGIYIMCSAGIWYHEVEDLSIDAEDFIDNAKNNSLHA